MFIQKDKESIPEWSKFILPLSPSHSFKNTSNSFLYLRIYNTGLYALTGGYGHKVIQGYVEDEFGLNVALRLIDNLSLSSIHQFSVKSYTKHIQRSVYNYNPVFDHENYNKILKSISGKGYFLGKNFLIQGKSSIVLRTEKDITAIDSIFDEIETILKEEEKIQIFRSYQQVKDKQLIKSLNLNLYRKLYKYYLCSNDDNSSILYLDSPDPFKRLNYSKYKLFVEDEEFEINELDIDEIRSKICDSFQFRLSLKKILNISITGVKIDGISDHYHKKSLDNLIVCESILNDQLYIKLDGKWFKILDDIINFVDERISNITIEKEYLPEWDKKHLKARIESIKSSKGKNTYEEDIYNREISENEDYKFLLLDKSMIQLDSISKIELADLYDPSKNRFIHVKDAWGAKTSYLFSQALISSTLYANSQEFREKCHTSFNIPVTERKTVVIANCP